MYLYVLNLHLRVPNLKKIYNIGGQVFKIIIDKTFSVLLSVLEINGQRLIKCYYSWLSHNNDEQRFVTDDIGG